MYFDAPNHLTSSIFFLPRQNLIEQSKAELQQKLINLGYEPVLKSRFRFFVLRTAVPVDVQYKNSTYDNAVV